MSNNAGQQLKFLTPSEVDGDIKGKLKGKHFVATGVFPEVGGGFGLNIERKKLKAIIESFDGRVTSSISAKMEYIIIGNEEPGEKGLEEAR